MNAQIETQINGSDNAVPGNLFFVLKVFLLFLPFCFFATQYVIYYYSHVSSFMDLKPFFNIFGYDVYFPFSFFLLALQYPSSVGVLHGWGILGFGLLFVLFLFFYKKYKKMKDSVEDN